MCESLDDILTARLRKEELVLFLEKHPELLGQAVQLSLSDVQPQAWRATWLIGNYIQQNDARLSPHINSILLVIRDKADGHQREFLKILKKLKLNKTQEGKLFDICLNIWEEIHKSASVRGTAFEIILSIVEKYPELKSEIEHLTQPHYTATLSPGIKRVFYKLINEEE